MTVKQGISGSPTDEPPRQLGMDSDAPGRGRRSPEHPPRGYQMQTTGRPDAVRYYSKGAAMFSILFRAYSCFRRCRAGRKSLMNGAAGLVRRALPPGAGSSGFEPARICLVSTVFRHWPPSHFPKTNPKRSR